MLFRSLKSEFLANVSHELTTPLTSIKGFARLLVEDFSAEAEGGLARLPLDKRIEFVSIVQREAERMTELIRGLLELSKIESGVVALDRSRVSLNTIVRESLLVVKPRLDDRELGADLSLDESLGPIAEARFEGHQAEGVDVGNDIVDATELKSRTKETGCQSSHDSRGPRSSGRI